MSLGVLPAILLYYNSLSTATRSLEKHKLKFGAFYENLSIKRHDSFSYNIAFILRRSVLVYLLFQPSLRQITSIQIITLIYLQSAYLMYFFLYSPFNCRADNRFERITEVSMHISTVVMILYTPILEPNQQVTIGWISLVSMLTIILRNLIRLFFSEVNKLKLRLIWVTLKVKQVMKKAVTALSKWNDERTEKQSKKVIDENELGLELNIMELSKSVEKDDELSGDETD